MNETSSLAAVTDEPNIILGAAEIVKNTVLWSRRDGSKPCAEMRQAASAAIDEIDALSRKLYQIRQQLVSEARASDDAAMARADALLRAPVSA